MRGGRARRTIENETVNTLKIQGYPLVNLCLSKCQINESRASPGSSLVVVQNENFPNHVPQKV
jgi:hypothetical protein